MHDFRANHLVAFAAIAIAAYVVAAAVVVTWALRVYGLDVPMTARGCLATAVLIVAAGQVVAVARCKK